MEGTLKFICNMNISDQTQAPLAIAGLIACLTALVAELTVHIASHIALGGNVLGALLSFVSYYTVGTNILLALIYVANLKPTPSIRLSSPSTLRLR